MEVNLYNVLGRIEPLGETTEDDKRYDNIENYDKLLSWLLSELEQAATYKNSKRYSEQRIGKRTYDLLRGFQCEIEDLLEEE
jgi:hypothetical protein